MPVISYPSVSSPARQPLFVIMERRLPGPWHTNRISMQLPSLQEAILAAKTRLQWESDLIVRIVDQNGDIHWTNEGP